MLDSALRPTRARRLPAAAQARPAFLELPWTDTQRFSNARSSCCVSAAAVFVDYQGSSLLLGAVRWLFRPAHGGRERDGLLSCFRGQGLAPVCLVCLVSASGCLGRARVGHRPPGSAELGGLVLPRLCFACAPRAPVTTFSSSTGPGARREHGSAERDGLLSCFRGQGLAPVCLVCLVSASGCLGRARVGHRPPGSAELGGLVLPRLCFACAPRAPVTTCSSSTCPGARREHGSRGAAHGSHERGYVRTVAAVCMLFSGAHSNTSRCIVWTRWYLLAQLLSAAGWAEGRGRACCEIWRGVGGIGRAWTPLGTVWKRARCRGLRVAAAAVIALSRRGICALRILVVIGYSSNGNDGLLGVRSTVDR